MNNNKFNNEEKTKENEYVTKEKLYLTTGECEKLTRIKARKVAELCNGGEVEGHKAKSGTYISIIWLHIIFAKVG